MNGKPAFEKMIHPRLIITAIALLTAAAAAATPATEKPVSVPTTTTGVTLAATLTLPATTKPGAGYPAVLLIQGSGPTDRDGNSRLIPGVKIDLLKQLADALAADGIATLRYDKRGMDANRDQMPCDRSTLPDFFAWDRFTDDAVAAYAFLAKQPDVDSSRVGILGHSEGGSLALVAADRLKSAPHPPAVLILIGTLGRPGGDVLADQLTRLMKTQHATDEQSKKILDANARIVAEIKKTGRVPDDVPRGLATLYPKYLGPFLKGMLSVDDVSLAAGYPGPVLVINGQRDAQVSPTLDAGALDRALKTRRPDDHAFVVVPGASHNLKHVDKETDPGFAGPVDQSAINEIRGWCREKLTAPAAR